MLFGDMPPGAAWCSIVHVALAREVITLHDACCMSIVLTGYLLHVV